MRPAFDLSLYLVLDPVLCAQSDLSSPDGLVETARAAVKGGATMVQLRDKTATTAALIESGRALKAVLAGSGVPLIINDNAEAAHAIGAEGLHIGQEDLDPSAARALIGPEMILGLSAETADLAAAIDRGLVDYAGLGPVFATASKPDHKTPIGIAGLARLVAVCPVPSVAIGGLKAQDAAAVIGAGAAGMAVVSAICGMPDPGAATRAISAAIREARA